MNDPIRELIDATRTDVESRIDGDGEWAAFIGLDSRVGDLMGELSLGRVPRSRRWSWAVAAAAIVLALIGSVAFLRPGDTIELGAPATTPAVVSPAVVSTVADSAAATSAPGTPSTTEAVSAETSVPADRRSDGVTYREPPPELTLRILGTVEVPEPMVGGYSVAIGDLGVAIGSWSYSADGQDRIQVLGFDRTARTVDVDADLAAMIAYGPGDVAYLTRQGDSIEDFALVAVALSGELAGSVVADEPANINRYLEYPPSSFGHGETGVIMRRDDGATAIGYVDINGQPTTLGEPAPSFYAADEALRVDDLGGRVKSSAGASWQLDVEAAPDRAGTYVGPSPPAPTSGGAGVYWTHVGPNLAPAIDFGEPSMWVVARLAPDGSVSWWSVPAGWTVVASDLWGTVLGKQNGEQLELALADFDAAAVNDGLSVSYLNPPPLYEPHVFAQLDTTTYSFGLGDGFVVAGVGGDNTTAADDQLIVLDLATNTMTTLDIERLPRALLAGPGRVVYGELVIDNPNRPDPDQQFVAIALDGERAGEKILEIPGLGHPVDPIGDDIFDHSAAGVIDTWHDDTVITDFIDPAGQRFTPEHTDWPLVRYDFTNDVMTQLDGPTWPLVIERHPNAANTAIQHVGAGAGGTAIYATWIGPAIGDDLDVATPTAPVIAALMPDGTGTWYRLPDGWWVADSNVWGTLLVSGTGNSTQLAWFDPSEVGTR